MTVFDQARQLIQLVHLAESARNRYIQSLRYEYSAREIARHLEVSPQTILNWTAKENDNNA